MIATINASFHFLFTTIRMNLYCFFQCCSFHAKCTQSHTSMTQSEQLRILSWWTFRYTFDFIIYAVYFTLNIWFPFKWYSIRISQLILLTLIINNTYKDILHILSLCIILLTFFFSLSHYSKSIHQILLFCAVCSVQFKTT